MKLGTQSRWSSFIINMIKQATFKSWCSPAFYRIAILKNVTSHKNVTGSFFKIKTSRKWWSPFSMLKTLRVLRKLWSPFSVLKTLRHWWCPFSVLKPLRVVRKRRSPFFCIKNRNCRKVVVELFLSFKSFKSRKKGSESFFSGHASLSFHMVLKFSGTTFSLSGPTEFLWL